MCPQQKKLIGYFAVNWVTFSGTWIPKSNQKYRTAQNHGYSQILVLKSLRGPGVFRTTKGEGAEGMAGLGITQFSLLISVQPMFQPLPFPQCQEEWNLGLMVTARVVLLVILGGVSELGDARGA